MARHIEDARHADAQRAGRRAARRPRACMSRTPRRLIAFLKAMEFNSLMRRVADFSGSMPPRSSRTRRWRAARQPARRRVGGVGSAAPRQGEHRRRPDRRSARKRATPAPADRRRRRSPQRASPRPRREVRSRALRDGADRRRVASTGSRARSTPAWSRSTPRPPASIRCRRSCAASRSRSRRTRPATCR